MLVWDGNTRIRAAPLWGWHSQCRVGMKTAGIQWFWSPPQNLWDLEPELVASALQQPNICVQFLFENWGTQKGLWHSGNRWVQCPQQCLSWHKYYCVWKETTHSWLLLHWLWHTEQLCHQGTCKKNTHRGPALESPNCMKQGGGKRRWVGRGIASRLCMLECVQPEPQVQKVWLWLQFDDDATIQRCHGRSAQLPIPSFEQRFL